ncbi:hypothetical protein [Paraburkholderia tropica]|uniref:hypothetical protein n=1 Tax=Paraburkholderia tropica TaxID=92647 RepID=UPI002ABD2A7E|nr:hypothetical protein [Paraburkholderia tropica]
MIKAPSIAVHVMKKSRLLIAGILALQALVTWSRIRTSAFFADDFLNFEIFREYPGFSLHYLIRDVFGQVAPGFRFVQGAFFELVGVTYEYAMALLIALSMFLTCLVYAFLRRFDCRNWAIFCGLVVYVLMPQLTSAQLWWSASVHTLFSTALILASAVCLAGPDGRGPTRAGRIMSVVYFGFALLFTAKVAVALVFLVGVFLYTQRGKSSREALPQAVRVLLPFVAPLVVYAWLVMRFSPAPGGPVATHNLDVIIPYAWTQISDTTLAAMVGLGRHGIATPWATLVAAVLVLSIMTTGARREPAILLLWAGSLGYIVASSAMIAIERAAVFPEGAYLPRYCVENVTFLVMVSVVALSRSELGTGGRWVALLAAVVVACNLQVQSAKTAPDGMIAFARQYVSNLKSSLRDVESAPDVVVLDSVVPEELMPAWMQQYRRIDMFLPLFTSRYEIAGPERATYQVDRSGRLEKIAR